MALMKARTVVVVAFCLVLLVNRESLLADKPLWFWWNLKKYPRFPRNPFWVWHTLNFWVRRFSSELHGSLGALSIGRLLSVLPSVPNSKCQRDSIDPEEKCISWENLAVSQNFTPSLAKPDQESSPTESRKTIKLQIFSALGELLQDLKFRLEAHSPDQYSFDRESQKTLNNCGAIKKRKQSLF